MGQIKDAAIDAANENREDRFQFERVGTRHFLELSSVANGAPYYLDVAQIISVADINLPDGKIGSDVTLANGCTTSAGGGAGVHLAGHAVHCHSPISSNPYSSSRSADWPRQPCCREAHHAHHGD